MCKVFKKLKVGECFMSIPAKGFRSFGSGFLTVDKSVVLSSLAVGKVKFKSLKV